jgi:sugar lactone lactonase YvrE
MTGSFVLQNNGGDNITVSSYGYFSFPTAVAYGSPYALTVLTQPAGQTCSITNGSGTMGNANISNVSIYCTAATYTVGGTVSGLNGSLVLQNNGGNDYTVSANGSFSFPSGFTNSYAVTVLTQPAQQRCDVINGFGFNMVANITNVTIVCTTLHTGPVVGLVGGTIQGTALNSGGVVSTLVGQAGVAGATDGTGAAAKLNSPSHVTTDGTNLYVADTVNDTIRQIVIATGVVTTLAGQAGVQGSADGTGAAATFNSPYGITTDGTNLYVADSGNNTIRQIVIATGAVSTLAGSATAWGLADGTGAAATFQAPQGITTDGTNLYVADTYNNAIRQIVIATGTVVTMNSLLILAPSDITTDGVNLYVPDMSTIHQIVIATGGVSTLAGTMYTTGSTDGTGAAARFNGPTGITTDGTNLYVADTYNNTIRQIVIASGVVSTLAGTAGVRGATDGTGAAAAFFWHSGLTTDGSNLYVTDSGNNTIRKIQ